MTMPTYNGFDLINVSLGVLILIYGIYVGIAPFFSADDGKPLARARWIRAAGCIIVAALFLWASPVDPDGEPTRFPWAIIIRLGALRLFWVLIDRYYDPMSEKRKHGAFSKR